jgi:hypothetical protein
MKPFLNSMLIPEFKFRISISTPYLKMASSFVSHSASYVLFVDNVQVGTVENRVPIPLEIPSFDVPVPVLPIFSEEGGFLSLQVFNLAMLDLVENILRQLNRF